MRVLAAILMLAAAMPAAAQGKKGSPPGHGKHPHPSDPASTSPASSSIRSIYLGSWIDDASMLGVGSAWTSISVGYWRVDGTHLIDAPVVDLAVGAAPRAQFGASVPFYHAPNDVGGSTSGVGQYFLYTKLSLRDPARAENHIGAAITPLVEVTNAVYESDGQQHVAWAAPISVEVRREPVRVYGSAGYFSRGALFATGAVEAAVTPTVTLTMSLGQTYSTSADATLGGAQRRTDLSFGTSRAFSTRAAIFGALGRSSSPAASAVIWFAGGVSILIR